MWLTAYAFTVVMAGTTLPTPLYPVYEQRWGFSALVITVIFAVYAIGVIAALVFLGSLSDRVGRRPALLAALALSAASAVAFLLADGLGALLTPVLGIGTQPSFAIGQRALLDVIPIRGTSLVKGSHGLITEDPQAGPLVISDTPELMPAGTVAATGFKQLVLDHVFAG